MPGVRGKHRVCGRSAAPLRLTQLCFRWLIGSNTINIQSQPSVSCVGLCQRMRVGPHRWGKARTVRTCVCVCAVPSKGARAPTPLHAHAGLPNTAVLKRGSGAFSLHTLPLRKGGQNQTVPHSDRPYRKLLPSPPKAAPDSENGARQKTACTTHELHRSSQKAAETTPWHKGTS